jgi:hypothetical protein
MGVGSERFCRDGGAAMLRPYMSVRVSAPVAKGHGVPCPYGYLFGAGFCEAADSAFFSKVSRAARS